MVLLYLVGVVLAFFFEPKPEPTTALQKSAAGGGEAVAGREG
jgi:hypothetical protein